MFVFLSKLLPLFAYPLGLACILLLLSLLFRRRRRLQTGLLIAAVALLWLSSSRWVAFSLVRSLEWRYLPPAVVSKTDVIVVLGGATESAQPPRTTVEINSAGDRVLYAARLYQMGKAAHILLSGGNITWLQTRTSTPAEEMADIITMIGVPQEALWFQAESQNTYEDALLCKKFLEQKGINRILLVTSAMHMPRAVALFEKQGFEVIPAPTDFSVTQADWDDLTRLDLPAQMIGLLPNSSYLGMTTNALKEYIGMLVYALQGLI